MNECWTLSEADYYIQVYKICFSSTIQDSAALILLQHLD